MSDSFFVSDKKRKRNPKAGPSSGRGRGRGGTTRGGGRDNRPSRSVRDEDVSSAESDVGGADFDTMDFRAGREDIALSDGEAVDENETAAEKRVRLAKGYLAKVKQDLEDGERGARNHSGLIQAQNEDDYDAAEIDRELIASRLQKDVVSDISISAQR